MNMLLPGLPSPLVPAPSQLLLLLLLRERTLVAVAIIFLLLLLLLLRTSLDAATSERGGIFIEGRVGVGVVVVDFVVSVCVFAPAAPRMGQGSLRVRRRCVTVCSAASGTPRTRRRLEAERERTTERLLQRFFFCPLFGRSWFRSPPRKKSRF